MTLPPLKIIPAGAGSGKTYTIQEQLGRWVAEGLVAPERIVAVTFTEAAASELRERIGAQLLKLDRVDDALKLEQAYISTIHGFGLRVLTEFAFEAGTSPQPRLLNEDEQNALIRMAVARTGGADEITSNLAAYGYRFDFNSKTTPEQQFREDLLAVVDLLRSVGWQAPSLAYAAQAAEWIARHYGATEDGTRLSAALRESVNALLREFPQSHADLFPGNKSATESLQKDFRHLRMAEEPGVLEQDWALWQKLRELRTTKRGSVLPDGYDARAQAVMAAADALPRHPGPLAHATRHIEALLAAGQDVLVQYAEAKHEAGLVDYADMVAKARQLLRSRPDVRETLVSRIDCLVVDEFQDTNPLQFALLWELAATGVPALVVGDLKQAIMGFQGADPRLFEALQRQHEAECRPLTRNWRSQPRLMAFINAVGPGLFGDAYVTLEPKAKDCPLEPLEVVRFPGKAKSGQHRVQAYAVGTRLRELLAQAPAITDRRTGKVRALRGSDVAVLAPTHAMLAEYAGVLRSLGLAVRLQADGWCASRAVEIARAALAYVANPADRHAALYLAVTELGSLTLEEGLRQLMETGRVADPLLERLDQLASGTVERTVYAVVADTLVALRLFDEVSKWPDGEQARANLLRLLAEAGEFMDANREALAHGGFHGSGVPTFLAWLAVTVERKEGDRQAVARVLDEDAIELATWHASKGREWPVVAVCGMDKAVKVKLPSLALGYSTFDDLSLVLERARIEYAPAFAAEETNANFEAELAPGAIEEARRLLYVALTRPRDKLILEWPEYLAGKDSKTYWSVLTEQCGIELGQGQIRVADATFPCAVIEGPAALPEELEAGAALASAHLPVTGRRAITLGTAPTGLTPDSRTPSGLQGKPGETTGLVVEAYGEAFETGLPLNGAALGSFLHRCFEVLGPRPDLVDRLPAATGVAADAATMGRVVGAVARFEAWLQARFRPEAVLREWPLLSMSPEGVVVSGTADLIVRTAEGLWIIDHKSDQVADPAQAFAAYAPQLASYASALEAEGQKVLGVAINWARRGAVALVGWNR